MCGAGAPRRRSPSVAGSPLPPLARPRAEPKWSDAFVELVAWFWTEGWAGSSGQVTITQSEKANPGHCARIRAALTAAFGPDAATRGVSLLGARGWEGRARIREALAADPALSNYAIARACGVDDHTVALVRRGKEDGPSWSQACEARGVVRFRLNAQAGRLLVACAPDKVVDTGFLAELTPAQLDLFIRVSLDADGSRNNTGTWVMAQKDRHRVEAFQIACALAGLSGGVRGPTRWGMWYMAVQASPWRWPCGQPQYLTRKTIDGPVWCPTTPNGTWFARCDGTTYFTGKTQEHESISLAVDTLRSPDTAARRPAPAAAGQVHCSWFPDLPPALPRRPPNPEYPGSPSPAPAACPGGASRPHQDRHPYSPLCARDGSSYGLGTDAHSGMFCADRLTHPHYFSRHS